MKNIKRIYKKKKKNLINLKKKILNYKEIQIKKLLRFKRNYKIIRTKILSFSMIIKLYNRIKNLYLISKRNKWIKYLNYLKQNKKNSNRMH